VRGFSTSSRPWPTAVGWTIEAEIQDGFAHDAL
jgi:hypothetical protein